MKTLFLIPLLAINAAIPLAQAAKGTNLPVAALTRKTPVDFAEEIMPFLQDNCLACHCKTTTKGGLNLETPELMIKGGDGGPGLTPGKSASSPIFQAAGHIDEDLKMPPQDNKAKAKNLDPNQLALLKLWIDQGAKPSPKKERTIIWQPMPPGFNTILAVTVTPDGQFAACARANRISFYHIPSGRLLSSEIAHTDQIDALAASPDGSLIASGGYREVKLWRRTIEPPKPEIADAGTTVAVSPNGKWMATGKQNGSVKIWSFPDAKPAQTIAAAKGAIRGLRFSRDNTRLACASADKTLTLWNVADGKPVAAATTPAEVTSVAWVGDSIASAGADGIIRVWDAALASSKDMTGHKGAVNALDSNATQLISGGEDGVARLWDVAKGKAIEMTHGAPITSVAIRTDGKRIASAGGNLAKLWDATGKAAGEMKGDRYAQQVVQAKERAVTIVTGTITSRKTAQENLSKQINLAKDRVKKAVDTLALKKMDIEPKQKAVAKATEEKAAADVQLAPADESLKKAKVAAEAAEKAMTQAKTAAAELKGKTPPDTAAIEKANAELAAKTKEFDQAKAELTKSETQRKQAAGKAEPLSKALADAQDALKKAEVAVNLSEVELKLANAEEQKSTAALAEGKVSIEAAEAAKKKADGDLAAARKAATDAEIPIRAIAFSPDGPTVATAGDDMAIHTWSGETGASCDVFKGGATPVLALAFAAGDRLVSAAQNAAVVTRSIATAWVLDRTLGSSTGKSPFADRIESLAFSPDGKFLAVGGGEPSRVGEVKLWNVQSGTFAPELPPMHSDMVLSMDFSADSRYLATGAADKFARVTDLTTGKVVKTFEGHTHHVLGVSWNMDARTLATAGADGAIKIWDVTTGDRKGNVGGYEKEVTSVRYLGASDQMLVTAGDNKVRIHDAAGGGGRSFPGITDFVYAAAASADGKTVLAGGRDSILRVWGADGSVLATFPPEKN